MAFNIETLRQLDSNEDYKSPERICVNAAGEIVDCESPEAAFLLVGKGSTLPKSEARRYGLLVSEEKLAMESQEEPDNADDSEAGEDPADDDEEPSAGSEELTEDEDEDESEEDESDEDEDEEDEEPAPASRSRRQR